MHVCRLTDYIYIVFNSFLELVPVLLAIPGASCFLSGRLNQDALEKHLGMHRQKGKSNDNPTVLQFVKNTDTLRQVGMMWFDDARGNYRKSIGVQQSIEDTKALPLRKRKCKRRSSC